MDGKLNLSFNNYKYSIYLDKDTYDYILFAYNDSISCANTIFDNDNIEENVLKVISICTFYIDRLLGENATGEILKDLKNDVFSLLNILLKIKDEACKFKRRRILSYLPERLGYKDEHIA